MPSEQGFDMVCLGGGVAAGELGHWCRLARVMKAAAVRDPKLWISNAAPALLQCCMGVWGYCPVPNVPERGY